MTRCLLQCMLCIYSLAGFGTGPSKDLGTVGLQYLYYYYIYEHTCDIIDHTGRINFCKRSNEKKERRNFKHFLTSHALE